MRMLYQFTNSKRCAITACLIFIIVWILQYHVTVFESNKRHSLPKKEWNNSVHDTVMKNRKRHLHEKCLFVRNSTAVQFSMAAFKILILEPHKLAMCYVPKTGCTFWKQTFYYLQSLDKKENNPENIFRNKFDVHYKPMRLLVEYINFDMRFAVMHTSKKMMFARNPYSRLFSGYIDKIFLPEFWSEIGTMIVQQTRTNIDPSALRCGHDVTFEEFLRRAVLKAKGSVAYYGDEHWFPVSKLCSPCTYYYDIIGKQETFEKDRNWILQKLGIEIPFHGQDWESKMVDAVTQTFFVTYTYRRDRACQPNAIILDRLWKAFKMQGYIAEDLPFSALFPNIENVSQKEVSDLFSKMVPSVEEFHRRRHKQFIKAYKSIPDELMTEIREAFAEDFLLFDYDPYPKELYSNR